MHQWTDLAESFLKMYSFAMLRSAGQKLYQIYHCTRFWPLRAAARSTHERGGTGHRTMVETRVVHEYQ